MPTLQQGIQAIKSGNKTGGRKILAQMLKTDPTNETAWLWLAQVVDTDEQRRHCLAQVLKINPHNEMARRAITRLQQPQRGTPLETPPAKVKPPPKQVKPAASPQVVEDSSAPETGRAATGRKSNTTCLVGGILAVVVVFCLGGAVLAWSYFSGRLGFFEPAYVQDVLVQREMEFWGSEITS